MTQPLSATTRRRLDIQGFEHVEDGIICSTMPWQRFAFGLCAIMAGAGTAIASVPTLLVLMIISGIAASNPVHPFDLLYNHGFRRLTGGPELPKRGAPNRFACGMGSVLLAVEALAFYSGFMVTGYVIGFTLTGVATLVATTDICIPSMMYRTMFGWPAKRIEAGTENVAGNT